MGGFVKGLGLPEEAGLAVGPFLKAIAEQARRESSQAEDENSTMETD
jgi:26S proteasome regulatory subunit N13